MDAIVGNEQDDPISISGQGSLHSQRANTFGKGMNPCILSLAMDKK